VNQTRFWEYIVFGQGFEQFPVVQRKGRQGLGSACAWGGTRGCPGRGLRAGLRFWAGIAFLLALLSTCPPAAMQLPAVSSCCCLLRMSPGVCCRWGYAAGCRLPASAWQASSPDASKAVSAKIRASGCGSPHADGGTCLAVRLPGPCGGSAAGRAAGSPGEPLCGQRAAGQLPCPAPLALLPPRHPARRWAEWHKPVCAPVRCILTIYRLY